MWEVETIAPGEQLYDYCRYVYHPSVDPVGRLRSSNLLWCSLGIEPGAEALRPIIDTIRRHYGVGRTVFGTKLVEGRLSWEFYFYEYIRRERAITMTRFLDWVEPTLRLDVKPDEGVPYFMFSVDLDPRVLQSGNLPGLHYYVYGQCAERGSRGLSYLLSEDGVELENHYAFFKVRHGMDAIRLKVEHSGLVDFSRISLHEVLRPQLIDCYTICIANKRTTDCVYFSRVNVDQLRYFLEWLDYPAPLRNYVHEQREALAHLRFCVGFDYGVRGGAFQVVKSGFYGVF